MRSWRRRCASRMSPHLDPERPGPSGPDPGPSGPGHPAPGTDDPAPAGPDPAGRESGRPGGTIVI